MDARYPARLLGCSSGLAKKANGIAIGPRRRATVNQNVRSADRLQASTRQLTTDTAVSPIQISIAWSHLQSASGPLQLLEPIRYDDDSGRCAFHDLFATTMRLVSAQVDQRISPMISRNFALFISATIFGLFISAA